MTKCPLCWFDGPFRLMEPGLWVCPVCYARDNKLLELKAEINSLKAELADERIAFEHANEVIGKLEAENARLWEVLKKIADIPECHWELSNVQLILADMDETTRGIAFGLRRAAEIARKGLEK